MQLRKDGVYRLPNGRVLIADGHSLLQVDESQRSKYEVDGTGRLLCDGKLTAWDVSQLMDTGVTAPRSLMEP